MDAFIPAPEDPADWPAWREALHAWRAGQLALAGPRPDAPDAVRGQYVQALVMLWDEELWNARDGWRVDALLDRAEREYGGWDQVVLWNNYPLSGLDPRDQYDYFADLPGGLDGLRDCVAAFRARGVTVMIDHKPWVPGAPEGFVSANRALAHVVEHCGLDGVYLDCGSHPRDDLKAWIDEVAARVGRPLLFCSEAPTPIDHLACQPWSWRQFAADSRAPGVMRNRWLVREALVFETRRYHYHPMAELQRAWLCGNGHVVWENVFGYWAAYSPRYRSWLRLVTAAQRRFADLLVTGDWQPLVAGRPAEDLYASRFAADGLRLYPLCNRSGADHDGTLCELDLAEEEDVVDVISGQELSRTRHAGRASVAGRVGVEGVAGLLVLPRARRDAELEAFLAEQRERHAASDFGFEPWEGEHRRSELHHASLDDTRTEPTAEAPDDMLPVPGYRGVLRQRYRMREHGWICDGRASERHVYDAFERELVDEESVAVPDLWMDRTPVTNAQFAAFLADSGYRPQESMHFLRHWRDGRPPRGREHHPVVYVDLEDARAYAAWAGKRLPTPAEWQQACLGARTSRFPWGDELGRGNCNDGSGGDTTAVDAFPRGASAFGCLDMIGNTWELTASERSDGHTRYVLLKGGCWYGADGSHWLFDGGPRGGAWAAKQILMHGGWDRCATVGFRCCRERSDGAHVEERAGDGGQAMELLGKAD